MTVDQTKKKKEQKLVQIGPGPGPGHLRTDLRSRPVRSGPGPAQKPTCGPVPVLVLKKLPQDQTGPDCDMAS